MNHTNALNRPANTDTSRSGFGRQNIIALTHQAIAGAQTAALNSDVVIIFETKPANAMAIADGESILHTLEVLFADAIARAPKGSVISVKVLLRGLKIMITVVDQGCGMNRKTIGLISNDFDQVTWPDTPDPTNMTIPSDRSGVDGTLLHIGKLAVMEKSRGPQDTWNGKASIRAVLAFPRITFH